MTRAPVPWTIGLENSRLDHPVAGMPGPVWTLAAFEAVAAVNLTYAFVRAPAPDSPRPLFVALTCYAIVNLVVLLLLRARTPAWFLHLSVAATIVSATVLVALSALPEGAVTSGIAYLTLTLYVAYWMPRWLAFGYVTAMGVAYAIGLALSGWPNMFGAWVLIIGTSFVVVVVLSTLVQALESVATTDQLTGLTNRRGLEALLAADDADRRGRERCLVVIDLDDFKALNDRLGHQAGDRALHEFGEACLASIRPEDLAVRSGGDEFVLVLDQLRPEGVGPVIERIRRASPVPWSYGVAYWPSRTDFDDAMARADADLYRRKDELRGDA